MSITFSTAQGTLTPAQLSAMNSGNLTHFITAIPAPGANLAIIPLQIIFWTDNGSAYSFGGFTPLLAVMYRSVGGVEVWQFNETLSLVPGELGFVGSGSPNGAVGSFANIALGFNLSQLGDNNPPTGGTGTNLHWTIIYTIEATA